MPNNQMIKGAIFHKNSKGDQRCQITLVKKPAIQHPTDVLIKMESVSICGTDVNALADPPKYDFTDGIIVGHEGCGIVEAVGDEVTNCKVGDKVVIHPNIWCGKCPSCRKGNINLCENFRHIGDIIDGAMSEYLCTEERMVYVIDSLVPSDVAALTEPLACVLNGTLKVKANPGAKVVILGGGAIGLMFAMLYQASGADVLVSEPQAYRRELASTLGITRTVNPLDEDLQEAVLRFAPQGAELIVDAVGSLVRDAIQIAGKGAHIVLFGINTSANIPIPQADIVMKELTLHGAYITKGTFPLAIQLIENHSIPIEKLITHRLPLHQIMDGIALMQSGNAGKVIIHITEEQ